MLRLSQVVGLAAALAMLIGSPVSASASVTSPAAVPAASLPSDAADHWALDEGSGTSLTNAVSGMADGTLSGGTSWVSGHGGTGSAVQFDGVDGLGSIGASPIEQQPTMTVTFWARAHAPGADKVIVALTGNDCRSPWSISTGASGSFSFSTLLSDGRPVSSGSSTPAASLWDGAWHFLAVTIRLGAVDGQFNTWIDGIGGGGGVISGSALVDYSSSGLGLVVGGPRPGCGTDEQFAGSIDDVRVYDRVLSSDELGSAVPQIPTAITLAVAPTFAYCDIHNGLYISISPAPANGGWVDISMDDGSGPVVVSSGWWTGSSGTIWDGCFPVGSETLAATFRGVPPFLGSASNGVPVTVTKRSSRVSLLVYPNPVPSDMQAAISIDAEPGTGTVSLYEVTGGGHRLVATQLPGSTWAYVGGLALGMHEFRAEYAGDAQTQPSTSDLLPIEVVSPAPTVSLTPLQPVTTNGSIALAWSATSGWSPVASYDVQYRRAPWNGGFGSIATLLSATTDHSTVMAGISGSTYCVSVRARALDGHMSAWTPETCTVVPLDDRSLFRSGRWAAGTGSGYYGSTYLSSHTYGSKLMRPGVAARQIALLVTTCRTCGSVKVYWGSTLLRRVSLYSATTVYRKLITVTTPSARSGALTITVSSRGKAVIIDGVAIRR